VFTILGFATFYTKKWKQIEIKKKSNLYDRNYRSNQGTFEFLIIYILFWKRKLSV
jgi:hypothetical protein